MDNQNNNNNFYNNNMSPINPGQTFNNFSNGHLNQTQHKFDRVEIVDHFDKGPKPVDFHIITTIDKKGNVSTDY